MDPLDQTASLMTPAKLASMSAAKPPASPAAFLTQMAADVGHQHVSRLKELHPLLGEQARASRAATVQPLLDGAHEAMGSVDFALLLQKKGFLAGLTGKGKSAAADFAAQVDRAEEALKAMATGGVRVGDTQRAHATASDRTLVECEVECRALDRLIDQGARWLQDMRNQLKTRQAQAGEDAAARKQIQEDAARCEVLVARLKALRAVASASQQAHQAVQAAAQRRAGLGQSLQKMSGNELREWQAALPPLAKFAAEGKASARVEDAQDVHQSLHKRIGQLRTDCAQLRADEEVVEQALATMGEQLAAVS